jgi:hypothetical protein
MTQNLYVLLFLYRGTKGAFEGTNLDYSGIGLKTSRVVGL